MLNNLFYFVFFLLPVSAIPLFLLSVKIMSLTLLCGPHSKVGGIIIIGSKSSDIAAAGSERIYQNKNNSKYSVLFCCSFFTSCLCDTAIFTSCEDNVADCTLWCKLENRVEKD